MKAFYSVMALVLFCVVAALCVGAVQNYFYPMAYCEQVKVAAKESGVDASLIASVANVESSFRSESVSSRGAVGLMQLMPSTAQWLCQKIGENYSDEKLFEPEYNLKLGAHYLSYLLQRFQNAELALCAYNAGPATVSGWLQDEDLAPNGKLEKIPFAETRNYVEKVNKNLYFYKNKYK